MWTELQWEERTVGNHKEYGATVPGGDPNHDFYRIQPSGEAWNVQRSSQVVFHSRLNRNVASLEEAKGVAQNDAVVVERLGRWAQYMAQNDPPATRLV